MRRKTTLLFLAVCFSVALSSFASASTITFICKGTLWHDANKNGNDDSLMCWAADGLNAPGLGPMGDRHVRYRNLNIPIFQRPLDQRRQPAQYGWHWWS